MARREERRFDVVFVEELQDSVETDSCAKDTARHVCAICAAAILTWHHPRAHSIDIDTVTTQDLFRHLVCLKL